MMQRRMITTAVVVAVAVAAAVAAAVAMAMVTTAVVTVVNRRVDRDRTRGTDYERFDEPKGIDMRAAPWTVPRSFPYRVQRTMNE